jgi:hypothetical protein
LTLDMTRLGPGEPQTCNWSSVSPSDLPPSPPSQEAAKLQSIREALRAHGDSFDPRRPTAGCPATFRAALLQALRTGRGIEPVDPTFETTDNQDPRILKLTCPFDIKDNPQVHEHQDAAVHFFSARDSGPAPYRLYHVEVDGNPANGSETVFAHTQSGTAASTVYRWVDFPRCWQRALRSVGGSLPPDTARTHLLVRYRGQTLVVALETAAPDSAETKFRLTTSPFTFRRPGDCTWTSGATGTPSGAR